MPYIKAHERWTVLNPDATGARNVGELNYALTTVALTYLRDRGVSYSSLADVEAAFGHAAKEIYRRIAVPYEGTKIEQNGDLDLFSLLGGI